MEMLKGPPSLSLQGNVGENFKRWKQRFLLYYKASGAEQKLDKDSQVALLLHTIGEDALEVYNTFDVQKEVLSVEGILKLFQEYCEPLKNETVSRHIFFTREKKYTESYDEFITALKTLSKDCGFEQLKNSLIRDQIVRGIHDKKLQGRLLKEDNLDLMRCIQICKATELATEHVTRMCPAESTISKVNYGHPTSPKPECSRCGYTHVALASKCLAYKKFCNKCKKPNHFAKMCKTEVMRTMQENVKIINNDEINKELFHLGTLSSGIEENFTEILKHKGNEFKVKLDTGADCNVMTLLTLININGDLQNIVKTKTHLTNYNRSKINCVGKIELSCELPNKMMHTINFLVIDEGNADIIPVLGLPTLLRLNLITRNKVNLIMLKPGEFTKDNIILNWPDVFEDKLGTLKDYECKINLKPNYVPKVEACRRIPFSLIEPLKQELAKLEKLTIISKVNEPTEFVSSLVIVKKPDNSLRVCLDPQHLNKQIQREHFSLPTFEEISGRIFGAKVFSVLDARTAFHQIRLSEKSRHLCTFNTPFGRYCFNRMPYGICIAPEVFHKNFWSVFQDIEGCVIFIDDMLIWGQTQMEHDMRLKKVLDRARLYNIILNPNKCKINTTEVKFLGHIFTNEGIKVDNSRIKAIDDIKEPQNSKQLLTFLGIITYIARFIPNLSQINSPLRDLLKKGAQWNWTKEHAVAFKAIKDILGTQQVLRYFDMHKSVVLSVDASKDGLGAVLMQDHLPVCYASKALSPTQKLYAQIEKETLAIVFGCERFHQYIYGRQVIVESDHRPLEFIFKKPLNECPLRLQRMRLQLQKYDLKIQFRPGKELLVADALSRNIVDDSTYLDDCQIETHVGLVRQILPITDRKYKEYEEYIKEDEELNALKNCIINNWPKGKIPEIVKPYYEIRNDLFIYKNVIFKGNAIIVPKKLRREVLSRIHYIHFGKNKCKNRARGIVFWPTMVRDIENLVDSCNVCAQYKKKVPKEPMLLRDLPNMPWVMLGSDVFHYKGDLYLVIIDYFTKYVELTKLKDLTPESTINFMKSIFARHGIPETIYTNGASNYCCAKFRSFMDEWGIVHKRSSPYHQQSNGLAERMVQTVKKLLIKCDEEKKDLYLTLLELRNTPIDDDMLSPAELLYGRKISGFMPNCNDFPLVKEDLDYVGHKNKLLERQNKQKYYYDKKGVRERNNFTKGNLVFVRQNKYPLKPAIIIDNSIRPRSYKLLLENGSEIERNKKDVYLNRTALYNVENDEEDITSPEKNYVDNNDNMNRREDVVEDTVPKNNVLENEDNTIVEPNNLYKTRSGRVIRPPKYLRDFV